MPYPALPEDQMDERTRQANALRRENLKDFGKDLWTNANGLADVVNSMVLNAGGQVLSGWEGYGDYFLHGDVDRMANIIEARNKSNEELFQPGERGQQYMQSLGEGLNAAKIAALRVPGVAKAAELARRGWEGLTNASPMLGASIVGAANVIDPTHGRAGRIARTAEEAAEMAAKAAVRQTPEEIASQIPRNLKLSPEDQLIEQNFARQIANDPDAALAWYSQHPETMGGKLIAPDIMREYSEDYVRDRSKSAAVHEPSSWASKRAYQKLLESPPGPGEDNLVMFNAGGTGAGKTTGLALRGEDTARAKAIYDTNMANFKSADEKIQQALNAGNDVTLQYTYRDPVEALVNGALKRAKRQERELGTGRTVPLDEHVKTHVNSSRTIKQLAEKYAGDDRVHITVIDNSRGPGNAAVGDIDTIPEMDYDQVLEGARNALEASYQNGDISEAIYRGFKESEPEGSAARGTLEANRAGNGQPVEPARQGTGKQEVIAALRAPRSVERAFEDVSNLQEAQDLARQGGHLKQDKAGKYVGAPPGVDTPEALAAQRAEADRLVEAGAPYRDWYDKEREVISDLTPDPVLQKLAARGGSLYSSQATPTDESGFFFKQHADATLGEEPPPNVRMGVQQAEAAKAYENYPQTGTFEPERISLGPKKEPYAQGKDPTVDIDTLWKTANDIRQGRLMGYGEDFNRGFTGAEHGFLTGENLLMSDRAAQRDALRGVTRDKPWNVLRAQASGWVAQAAEANFKEAMEAALKQKAKNPKFVIDEQAILEKAWHDASDNIERGVNRHSVALTGESRTGAGTRHLVDVGAEDPELAARLSALRGGRNRVLDALDQYSTTEKPTIGEYVPEGGGPVERNIGNVSRYPTGTAYESGPPNKKGEPTRGAPYIPDRARAAAEDATDTRALFGAQEAGAFSRFFPEGMGRQPVSSMSGVEVDLKDMSREEQMALADALRGKGLSLVNQGDVGVVFKLGEAQGNRFGPLPKGNYGILEGTTEEILDALPEGAKTRRGSVDSYYQPTGLTGPEGTGEATEGYLARSEARGEKISRLEERTDEALAQEAQDHLTAYREKHERTGQPMREDLMRMLEIVAGDKTGQKGRTALRAWIAKNGKAGLPVALLTLAGFAGSQSEEPDGA